MSGDKDLIREARAGNCEDRSWMIDVIDRLADRLEAIGSRACHSPAKHGPDWSDWQEGDDGPSCLCGFNGTPEECAASRKATTEQQGESQ